MFARHPRSLVGVLASAMTMTLVAVVSCTPCGGGTQPPPCGGNDNGFFLAAHLQVARDDLRGGYARVCWRDRCSEWTLPADFDRGLRSDGSPVGGGFNGKVYGTQRLVPTIQGWLRIEFEARLLLEAPALLHQNVANGDVWSFLVRRADGRVLLDVDRAIDYQLVRAGNKECSDPACYAAFIDFYADSQSQQRCSARRCFPIGVRFPTVIVPSPSPRATASLCRNDLCERHIGAAPQSPTRDPGAPRVLTAPETLRRPDDVVIELATEPAALAEGDRYRYFVEDQGRVVYDKTIIPIYETSFPNGEQCDPHACRTTILDFR